MKCGNYYFSKKSISQVYVFRFPLFARVIIRIAPSLSTYSLHLTFVFTFLLLLLLLFKYKELEANKVGCSVIHFNQSHFTYKLFRVTLHIIIIFIEF